MSSSKKTQPQGKAAEPEIPKVEVEAQCKLATHLRHTSQDPQNSKKSEVCTLEPEEEEVKDDKDAKGKNKKAKETKVEKKIECRTFEEVRCLPPENENKESDGEA